MKMNKESKADSIIQQLGYDSSQAKFAHKGLIARTEDELSKLNQRILSHRGKLVELNQSVFRGKLEDFEIELNEWAIKNSAWNFQYIESSRLWLENERTNVAHLAFVLKTESRNLLEKVRRGEISAAEYVPVADRIARSVQKKLKVTMDFDDKVSLADLASDSLININRTHADGVLFSRAGSAVYNCVEACILLDQLGGLDQNADRFGDTINTELRRLGPLVLILSKSIFSDETDVAEEQVGSLGFDELINCASLLQIWGSAETSSVIESQLDEIFGTSIKLIELASRKFRHQMESKSLVYCSWLAGAYYRHAEAMLMIGGISKRDSILETLKRGIDVLDCVLLPNGKFYDDGRDLLGFELKKMNFGMLCLEADQSLVGVRDALVHSILRVATKHGSTMRTARPWMIYFDIFTRLYPESDRGIKLLEEFIASAPGAIIEGRAKETRRRIEDFDRRATEKMMVSPFDLFASKSQSIFSFKEVLGWYGALSPNERFELQGKMQTEMTKSVVRRGYFPLFTQLVEHDRRTQMEVDFVISSESGEHSLGILDFFAVSFGQNEIWGMEEITKFLLARGRSESKPDDILWAAALLQHGLKSTDDPYWHARLSECYQDLGDFEIAERHITNAAQYFPNDPVIALQKSLLMLRLSGPEEALVNLEEFLSDNGRDLPSSHLAIQGLYAYSALTSGRLGLAEGTFRTMLGRKPNDVRARHGLGTLLIRGDSEQVLEGVGSLIDCILAAGSSDSRTLKLVYHDSLINICQRLAAFERFRSETVSPAQDLVKRIGSGFRTWQLRDFFQSLQTTGGCSSLLPILKELTVERGDSGLNRSFVQLGASCLIEQIFKDEQTVDENDLFEFSIQNDLLGDLVAGSKGSYARNLVRLVSNPLSEKLFKTRLDLETAGKMPEEWRELVEVVASSGYSDNYYSRAYSAIEGIGLSSIDSISSLLRRTIFETARVMLPLGESKKILLDTCQIRVVRNEDDYFFSALATGTGLNCDPDVLSFLACQHLENMSRVSEFEADFYIRKDFSVEDIASYASANISLTRMNGDLFCAKVSSAPRMMS